MRRSESVGRHSNWICRGARWEVRVVNTASELSTLLGDDAPIFAGCKVESDVVATCVSTKLLLFPATTLAFPVRMIPVPKIYDFDESINPWERPKPRCEKLASQAKRSAVVTSSMYG